MKRIKKSPKLKPKLRQKLLLKHHISKEDHQKIQLLHQFALTKRVKMEHHVIKLSPLAKNLAKFHHLMDALLEVLSHQENLKHLKSPKRRKRRLRKRRKRLRLRPKLKLKQPLLNKSLIQHVNGN
jgi:hypothetical protein